MKDYKKTSLKTIKAYQFNGEEDNFIKRIMYDDRGGVMVSPVDPIRKVYYAFKENNEWRHVNKGEWIVHKKDKILIVQDAVFQLLYDEI